MAHDTDDYYYYYQKQFVGLPRWARSQKTYFQDFITFAEAAAFLAAIGVLTSEKFILLRKGIHNGSKRAKWALL